MGADLLGGDVELTEFTELDVQSVKAVKAGANGFPILLMKGLPAPAAEPSADEPPADGEGAGKSAADLAAAAVAKAVTDGQVDEKPDIALGQQIMSLLGQAIGNEAQEISAGSYGEARDVDLLNRAAGMVSCWLAREQAVADGQDPDASCGCCEWCSGIGCGCCPGCGSGMVMCSAADDAVAKAKLKTSEVNDLPDSAFAYIEPGGTKDESGKTTPRSLRHFPVHDKAHADNAAARIAQGAEFGDKALPKVKAAQKQFGESDTSKGAVAEGETAVDTDAQEDTLAKGVEDALAKALAPQMELLKGLEARLAKVEQTPVPGGPVMSVAAQQRSSGPNNWAAKAAYYREMAGTMATPADAEGYRQLAREADEKAQAPAG